MNLKQIYKLATEIGIKNDFRTKKEISEYLKEKKEEYDNLSKEDKRYFDKEMLTNPYSDSRIHFEKSNKKNKKVLASIDITTGGLLIARELKVDVVINHHPVGSALANLDDVMSYQIDQMEKIGVPVNIAEKLIHKRISEVARGINASNHYAIIDSAKALGISFLNIHTPADNAAAQFMTKEIEKAKPKYVKDIIKIIENISEYKESKKRASGATLFSGSEKNRAGKIVVSEFTGGTEGSKEIYQNMANAGVGTIIAMHQSEAHREAAEKAHINVVVANHIASDSLGMNIFLDELERKGIKIIPFGGLIRVSRVKKK
jgi:putative NIF3 family GTP cyclohydrolase 1 type 2